MKSDLIIHLEVGPDRDLRDIERHTANLRGELNRLEGVESVQPVPLGEAPPGAKVIDPASVCAFLTTIASSQDVIVALVRLLATWVARANHRSLKIQVGQSIFEMKGGSAKERKELAERMFRELHPEDQFSRMNGGRFGLLVACSDFENESLRTLHAPPADVEALADILRRSDVGGFDIKTLVNQPRQVVELAMQAFFLERKHDDLVLLYFSGHGLKDDSNNLYFAMTDTKRRYLEATAVSSRFVREIMQNCPARRQVLLLDCCFSGAFPRGWTFRADETIGSVHYFDVKGSGQAILTACDDMQYAFEGDEVTVQKVTPSMFTEIVVEGIASGEADADCDGKITIDDLHAYALDELRRRNSRQNPQKWSFGLTDDIVLATNPKPHVKALAEELRSRVESEDVRLRLAAVHDLGNLARRSDGRRRLAATEALKMLIKDDSRAVSAAAKATLDDVLGRIPEEIGQEKERSREEDRKTRTRSSTPVSRTASSFKDAKEKALSVASTLVALAKTEYSKLQPKRTQESEYEHSIATKTLVTDPPPQAKTWRAELVSGGWSKRILRVELSDDAHLIEFRLTSAATRSQIIKIDGLLAAEEGTALTWQEKFDFCIADGKVRYLATIEAQRPVIPLKLRGLRLLIAGRLLYSE